MSEDIEQEPIAGAGPEAVKKLRRSRSERLAAGVCGGLAEYFGLPSAVYRIAFVALTFVGGTGLLLYVAAALVIPDEGTDESIAARALREHRDRPWLVVGLGLLAIAAFFFLSSPHVLFGPVAPSLWVLVLLAGGLIVWSQLRHHEDATTGPAAATPRRASVFWPGVGLLLGGAGVLGLVDELDVFSVNWPVALAGGVILVGILVAIGGWRGGAAGLAVVGLLLVVAMGAALAAGGLEGGVGDRLERPLVADDLRHAYRLSVGELDLDLGDVTLREGETRLKARVGIGELTITVPRDVALSVRGDVRLGDATVLGRQDDGAHVHERVVDPGFEQAARRLVVDAHVGIGDLEVRRADS